MPLTNEGRTITDPALIKLLGNARATGNKAVELGEKAIKIAASEATVAAGQKALAAGKALLGRRMQLADRFVARSPDVGLTAEETAALDEANRADCFECLAQRVMDANEEAK